MTPPNDAHSVANQPEPAAQPPRQNQQLLAASISATENLRNQVPEKVDPRHSYKEIEDGETSEPESPLMYGSYQSSESTGVVEAGPSDGRYSPGSLRPPPRDENDNRISFLGLDKLDTFPILHHAFVATGDDESELRLGVRVMTAPRGHELTEKRRAHRAVMPPVWRTS